MFNDNEPTSIGARFAFVNEEYGVSRREENRGLRPSWPGVGLYSKNGGVLSLTGAALSELAQAILEKGAPFRFQARGSSMYPFIKDDDVVTVEPLAGDQPGLGDVVSFIYPETGKLVVHRIIAGQGDAWRIKGDGNFESDGLIPRANILGCVKKLERKGATVRFGLGPEKILISRLSLWNFFTTLLIPFRRILLSVSRRSDT